MRTSPLWALLAGLLCLPLQADNAGFQQLDLAIGKSLFEKNWVTAPASTGASDGLGPLYNVRSCAACHDEGSGLINSPVLRIDDPVYGSQIQTRAASPLPVEARVHVEFTYTQISYPDGTKVTLKQPFYSLQGLAYGDLQSPFVSPRLPLDLAGAGLLDSLEVDAIVLNADPDDLDQDGISGRFTGRFGRKGGVDSLTQQVALALALDMGLGSPVFPDAYGDCTDHQVQCFQMANGNSQQHDLFEVNAKALELLVNYVAALPAPLEDTGKADMPGAEIFRQVGCAVCHMPTLQGETLVVRAWSDLLVHDMGAGLADQSDAPSGLEREWRTSPLWGLGERVQRAALLHDGRAGSLEEAVLWHAGEASSAVQKYMQLEASDRKDLFDFLISL